MTQPSKHFGRAENVFLLIALVWGLLFCFVTPPFQVPDENRHLFRAVQIARGGIVSEVNNGMVGGWIPKSVFECGRSTRFVWRDESLKISAQKLRELWQIRLEPDNKVFVELGSMAAYSPIPYLPAAVACRLSLWFNARPLAMMYASRVLTCLCWVGLMYTAVRVSPIQKWVIVFLALLPTSIYAGGSVSADAATNGLTFLAFAVYLYFVYGSCRQLGWGEWLAAVLVTVCLSLSKSVFFPFCFLFLFVPGHKFAGTGRRISYLVCLVAANIIAVGLWGYVVKNLSINWGNNIEPARQLEFIFSNPLSYAATLGQSMFGRFMKYLIGYFARFGWGDTPLPWWQYPCWGLTLAWLVCRDGALEVKVALRERIVFVLLCAFSIVEIFTLIYLSWNPIGSRFMEGVQGRYFIGLGPVIAAAFCNRRFSIHSRKEKCFVAGFLMLFLSLALWRIAERFYQFC